MKRAISFSQTGIFIFFIKTNGIEKVLSNFSMPRGRIETCSVNNITVRYTYKFPCMYVHALSLPEHIQLR